MGHYNAAGPQAEDRRLLLGQALRKSWATDISLLVRTSSSSGTFASISSCCSAGIATANRSACLPRRRASANSVALAGRSSYGDPANEGPLLQGTICTTLGKPPRRQSRDWWKSSNWAEIRGPDPASARSRERERRGACWSARLRRSASTFETRHLAPPSHPSSCQSATPS